jgi:hypothetical protein
MPVENEPEGNNRRDVTDISSVQQLLCYALAGQLEPLLKRRGLTQGKIAHAAGLGTTTRNAGPVLTVALKQGPTPAQLGALDQIISALAPDLNGAGGLSSLDLRLATRRRGTVKGGGLTAHVPPSWTRKILADPPADDVGVLIQASALLSEFVAADKMDMTDVIRDRYKNEMELLVRRLILISVAPPTSRNYDAQMLLGMLASYAFELMRGRLEYELQYSPLGFRVWRAVTKLVTLRKDGEHTEALRAWVRWLIRGSEELRTRSLNASSSLDLELAIAVPAAWSPPGDDWAGDALLTRARNNKATMRERGTAALGLWQRAIREGRADLEETQTKLRELIAEFRDPGTRPDAPAGMRWIAATLEHVIDNRVEVCNDWPDVGEPWFQHVQEVANDDLGNYDIPPRLLTGTKNLFRHIILQNAGVYRRQAIETVVTSGWTEPVARALESLLAAEKDEAWLRSRAEFALGFLQRPDIRAEAVLTSACERAYQRLRLDQIPDDASLPPSHETELQTSLFAVGDCLGVPGAEERAKSARTRLRPILEDLAGITEEPRARRVRRAARAAAYLLTMTAQPSSGDNKDLSRELLEKLSDYPDPVTRKLSRWALSFRFAPDGTIRPLLAAAEYGETDDAPY